MKAIKQITGICLSLSLVACTSAPVQETKQEAAQTKVAAAEPQVNSEYLEAHRAAKASLKAASQAGYQWRDSGKILKKAEQAAKKGNYDKAIKLANQAQAQGQLAVAQSKEQVNAGPRFDDIVAMIQQAEQGIATADAERKKAGKLGFEWRDTGKILKKAKKALANHDYEKAAKLADKAKKQGEAAQLQAMAQRGAGPRF